MTIGFIGLGLIGGSLAKTIRRIHPDIRLIAYNRTVSVVNEAIRDGVIDQACFEITAAFAECDLVFLCVPVLTMRPVLKALIPHLKPGALVSDAGSTKSDIHALVSELGLSHCFIGGHPMAGSEKSGYAASTDRMFENAWYILTPGHDVPIGRLSRFSEFISSLGAMPLILTPEEHDYAAAAISHLPHVVSAALVNTVRDLNDPDDHMKSIAAGGFKDITRISSSSPRMWQEICLANAEPICIVLERFIRNLTDFRFAIRNGNGQRLDELFTMSRDFRESFDDNYKGAIEPVHRLYMDINDEPGAIASVAALMAGEDISIRNIGIVNNRVFDRGVLKIEFYDAAAVKRAAKIFRKKGFRIYEE